MNGEEAMERGVMSVTPESNKPNTTARRNSTEQANTGASPSLSNSDGIPHYLRASMGSCHDFCKYGRKHAFEAKKRHPALPTFLGSNGTTNEEHNQAKVSTLLERRKKLELKLKQPKTGVSNGPKVIKQKGLSPDPYSPSTQADGSSEELLNITSVEHTPANQAEGSSEESESIKLMIPSPCIASDKYGPDNQAGLSEELITMQLGTPSPTRKSIVSALDTLLNRASAEYIPASLAERLFEEPVGIDIMTPSPVQESIASAEHTLANQAERSSKKPISMKLKTSSFTQESIAFAEHNFADRVEGSSEGSLSIKPKNSLPIQKSIASAKRAPANLAEKLSEESVSMKLKSPSPVQKSISSAEHTPAKRIEESSEEQDQVKSLGLGDRKKRQVTKLKTAQQLKTVGSDRPKVIKQKNTNLSGETNIIKRKTPSPVKKTITSVEPKLAEQKSLSYVKKTVASRTPKIIKQKAASPPKRIYVSAKPSISLKSKTAVVKSASPLISSGGLTGRRNQENRIIWSASLSETGEKKILKPPKASLSPKPVNGVSTMNLRKYRITKPASSLKTQAKAANGEHDTEIVREKTLYVIEPKQENIDLKPTRQKLRKYKSSLSSQSSSSSSSSSPSVSSHGKDKHEDSRSAFSEASGSNSESKGRRSRKPAAVSKGDNMQRPRRTATVCSEDRPPSPHKLKFQRGKVVNLQSENNAPRRLRFRPARVASAKQNDVERRSFRKRRESNGADSNPPSSETPTVVLRHQDVQDKKDSQGLFNHVIEETASKLVETRKSKVKALVGAFETVISLQESKVAPTV